LFSCDTDGNREKRQMKEKKKERNFNNNNKKKKKINEEAIDGFFRTRIFCLFFSSPNHFTYTHTSKKEVEENN